MRVSLVCVAKNEDRYIEEWADYHTKLGFDEIVVFQNDWTCVLQRDNLKKFTKNGRGVQLDCYNGYLSKIYESKEVDWVAFFDVDEFLVLKQHSNIKEFLENYEDSFALGVNWYMFGNNNLEKPSNGLVKRFTRRHKNMDRHVKSILNIKKCSELNVMMNSPHSINDEWVDTLNIKKSGPFNYLPTDKIAQINHYFAKTMPEFMEKIKRGRASCRLFRNLSEYNGHITNDVEDLCAYNFMYRRKIFL